MPVCEPSPLRWSHHWKGELKFVCINSPGYMAKMAATLICGKDKLLQNQKSSDLETW